MYILHILYYILHFRVSHWTDSINISQKGKIEHEGDSRPICMIFLLIKNNFSTERKAQMTVDCRLHLISMQCLIVSNCTKMNIQINQSFTIVCLPDHGVHKKKKTTNWLQLLPIVLCLSTWLGESRYKRLPRYLTSTKFPSLEESPWEITIALWSLFFHFRIFSAVPFLIKSQHTTTETRKLVKDLCRSPTLTQETVRACFWNSFVNYLNSHELLH